jgi:hypothetical protein
VCSPSVEEMQPLLSPGRDSDCLNMLLCTCRRQPCAFSQLLFRGVPSQQVEHLEDELL